MKAPAVRVLIARIEAKVTEEKMAAETLTPSRMDAYYKACKSNRDLIDDLITKAVAKNIKKYVKYEFSLGASGFSGNEEFYKLVAAIKEANPGPTDPQIKYQDISIPSLNMAILVTAATAAKWTKFATDCDEAFLEDDAKAILAALEAL